ncbi:hypothetical protein ACFC0M_10340 [Streptomyces sp. NPDC056149]|nr:hypothetical protein [Streptomyces sp. WZ-12]
MDARLVDAHAAAGVTPLTLFLDELDEGRALARLDDPAKLIERYGG